MSIAAMKLALDALEANQPVNYCMNNNGEKFAMMQEDPFKFERNTKVITALRQAIEQSEQAQPMITKNEKGLTLHVGWDDLPAGTKLYADLSVEPLPDEETSELANDPIAYLQSIWNLREKP